MSAGALTWRPRSSSLSPPLLAPTAARTSRGEQGRLPAVWREQPTLARLRRGLSAKEHEREVRCIDLGRPPDDHRGVRRAALGQGLAGGELVLELALAAVRRGGDESDDEVSALRRAVAKENEIRRRALAGADGAPEKHRTARGASAVSDACGGGTSFGTLSELLARTYSSRAHENRPRSSRFAGASQNGETRTRTGDTTIFRDLPRARETAGSART
jgi:hypothetical protein